MSDVYDTIVTTEKGKVLYIGDRAFDTAVKRNLALPIGFSSSRIRSSDKFFLYIRSVEMISEHTANMLGAICGDSVPDTGSVIIVCGGKLSGKRENLIVKVINKEKPELHNLIDTVFDGVRIKAEFDENISGMRITTGHQTIDLSLKTNENCLLVVYDESEIRYYGSENNPEKILGTSDIKECWKPERNTKNELYVQDVLDETLAEFICKSINGQIRERKVVRIRGTDYVVSFNELSPYLFGDERIYKCKIETAEGILDAMRDNDSAYRELIEEKSSPMRGGYTFGLWGDDKKTVELKRRLQKAAVTNTTILLTGESGTGKTYLAEEIHKNSRRSDKPFVHVNCAAIPYNLLESELFGYESGAFTGARRGGKAGYFQMAEGGTLFLDEITELPVSLQGKLLEALQEKTYFRVGGESKYEADVRLIAATNANLYGQVERNLFRKDLYYRINVFPIEVPPLRERMNSLPAMVSEILPEICHGLGVNQQIISVSAMEKMRAYSWPGNIRELENILEKACILSDGSVILPEDIEVYADSTIRSGKTGTLKFRRREAERDAIINALEICRGNKAKAARYLEIGRTSLFEKMKEYNIKDETEED